MPVSKLEYRMEREVIIYVCIRLPVIALSCILFKPHGILQIVKLI